MENKVQILKDAKGFWTKFVATEQSIYALLLRGQPIDDAIKDLLPVQYHSKINMLVADTPGMLNTKLRNTSQYHLLLSTGNRAECIYYVETFYKAYRAVILQHFFVTKYSIGSLTAIDEKTEYNGVLVDGLRYNIDKNIDGKYDIMVFVDECNLHLTSETEFAYVEPSDDLLVAMYHLVGEFLLITAINKIQFYPAILYPDIIRKTIGEIRAQMDCCNHCLFCGTPSYCCDFQYPEFCSIPCRQTANPRQLTKSVSKSRNLDD